MKSKRPYSVLGNEAPADREAAAKSYKLAYSKLLDNEADTAAQTAVDTAWQVYLGFARQDSDDVRQQRASERAMNATR